mgnify:CR=1 FL=1
MDDNKQGESFRFRYSAKEQEELKRIRQKYLPPEEDKMQKVRKLDAYATNKATMISIITGIIGALILGTGMCCCLVWQDKWFIPGIVVGILGMAAIGLAYPAYQCIAKKEREKIAQEILRLTEELIK